MIKNILGRTLPETLFGVDILPYQGIHASRTRGRRRVGPKYQPYCITRDSKRFYDDIDHLLGHHFVKLFDGMSISFHHILRNGDGVVLPIIDAFASYGIKYISLASTALFPVHSPLLEHIETGVIGRIESSMNGPIGRAVSRGEVAIPTILRSHGGRARAVQEGSLHIDIAFIAASAADFLGNLTGIEGRNAFGSLGYSLETDSLYADVVIGVTDTILDYPLENVSIPSRRVDAILEVDSIGDPSKITSGSLRRKLSPERLKIAETAVQVMYHSGFLQSGFNWQAGAGGMSLATTKYLKDLMVDKNLEGSYIFGGIAGNSVDLLESGLFKTIYDAQSFDTTAIESLRINPNHVEVSIDHAYNPFNKGCIANNTDFSALGATEVDVNFNVNVNTFSDGTLNSGIGGHQDAARAKISMILLPLARKVPCVIDNVITVSSPGDCIDIIVTNGGIAINPKRKKLKKRLKEAGLNIRPIENLKEEALSLAEPMEANLTDHITTLIEYRDWTHLDVIYQVE
ncbi:MAG: citrate lyase subunit alpha [Candidatus Heimdallarchaeota archaeon]|nr:MAG: citrate lyase subunit alpha [Candidatus Heimdallarchaeota archaeon]